MTIDRAWVVVNRNGSIILSSIAGTRRKSIENMVGLEDGAARRWASWKRDGCRAVRVRLVAVGGREEG